jgi:ATP-dependent Clp protease adaptor protein ClpS
METETIERVDTNLELKEPEMYKVLIHNDNVTTVDFVVATLMGIFHKTPEESIQITLAVHEQGKGIAGVYTKEIAEEKTYESLEFAKANRFPLLTSYEVN